MTSLIFSVLAFAALFAGFGLLNRGRETAGCGSCHGACRCEGRVKPQSLFEGVDR